MSTPGRAYPDSCFFGDRRKQAGQSAGLTGAIATVDPIRKYGFAFQGKTVLIGEAEPAA